MVKKLVNFRLRKNVLEYLDQLVEKGQFPDRTKAIERMVEIYKNNDTLIIDMPDRWSSRFMDFYNKVIPFIFASLFTYFYFLRSWFFLPFLFVASIPILLPLERHKNLLRLVT